MLTTIDIAWASGFLEGEGNFARQSKQTVMPKVSAGQVQREPLDRLKRIFGGSIYPKAASTSHGRNAQAAWIWYTSGPRAVQICLTLYGLMSPKRKEQIDKALAVWRVSPVRRQPHSTLCSKGHQIIGDNAIVSINKGKKYTRCRSCAHADNEARHAREKLGRTLIPRIAEVEKRRSGATVLCPICGEMFTARNSRHSYCSTPCSTIGYTRRVALMRAAVQQPRKKSYARLSQKAA